MQRGVYEEIGPEEVRRVVTGGNMVSSAFVVRQGEKEERHGRFVVNFHRQSKHWPKGSVKMKTLPSFAVELQKGDTLMSWDIKSSYPHFYLHPDVRDFFVFRYGGHYFRCIALPFGWGRSVLWFTKLLRPLVQYLREKLGYRILPYIDDFVAAPCPYGTPSSPADCRRARRRLTELFGRLGIVRHPEKGCWESSQKVDHLGVHIDTVEVKVFVSEKKVEKVRSLAQKIMLLAQKNRRLVSLELLRHFCGVCVSLTLALPLARFYTRSIYFDMSLAERKSTQEERGQSTQPCTTPVSAGVGRSAKSESFVEPKTPDPQNTRNPKVRLCRQSLRDLKYSRSLSREEGRDLIRINPHLTMHSDAADVGYGGTLGLDEGAGIPGLWEGRGFWNAENRAHSIPLRELRAVRLVLHRHLAGYVSDSRVRRMLLHEENQRVVYILNSMVSASKVMMEELPRLEVLMRVLGVKTEVRWIPSAVNKFADALSRTWDPGDARATDALVNSIQKEFGLSHVAFRTRPLGDALIARKKYLATQMGENWSDGKARLWNPPFDLLPLVVSKIEAEGGRGVLY